MASELLNLLVTVAAIGVAAVLASVKRVPERHAGIIERLGRFRATAPAGTVMVIPVIDSLADVVDLGQQSVRSRPRTWSPCPQP